MLRLHSEFTIVTTKPNYYALNDDMSMNHEQVSASVVKQNRTYQIGTKTGNSQQWSNKTEHIKLAQKQCFLI